MHKLLRTYHLYQRASVLFTFFLLLTTFPVKAITYQWPVLTHVDVVSTSPTDRSYTAYYSTVTITDPSITETDTVADVFLRKTGVTTTLVMNGVVGKRFDNDGKKESMLTIQPYWSDKKELFSHYWPAQIAWIINGYQVRVVDRINVSYCFGILMFPSGSQYANWDNIQTKSWDGGTGTKGTCMGTKPTNQWCALTTPSVTFDYGRLTVSGAPGASLQRDVEVQCTTAMKYTLRLLGVTDVSLSNGMHAAIQANGAALNSSLDGIVGANKVTLTSTLTGVPASAGAFTGQSVLFVSYP